MKRSANYKRVIILPERVSQSVFDLPCIVSINKYATKEGFFYELTKVNAYFANPGDILAEDNDGRWWLLSQEEYKQWRERQTTSEQ